MNITVIKGITTKIKLISFKHIFELRTISNCNDSKYCRYNSTRESKLFSCPYNKNIQKLF